MLNKVKLNICIFIRMDASKITELLQKKNTRYINRCQTVDSSTLIWKNQIQSSKYIKGVKTCEGEQNCNVPTNPACPDSVAITPGSSQLVRTGINAFGGAGRTTAIQTGSPQQFLSVLSGASGSASEVYSSERILLQKAGKESCGVPGLNPITTTTTDSCGNSTTTVTDNTYITLPACYCENTNGPMGPRYNVIGQNPGIGEWATRIGSQTGTGIQELIDIVITKPATTRQSIPRQKGNKSSPTAKDKAKIKWVCPVICTSNSIKEKKMQSLLRYGSLLHIDKPATNDLNKLITRITKAEDFQLDSTARDDIITRANGDYRQVIHLCYSYYNKLHTINPLEKPNLEIDVYKQEDDTKHALIKTINDVGETPLDKINYFITHTTSLDIIRYFCSGDSNLYFMNFYNNVIPILSKIQEKTKEPKNKDTFLKAYKTLAKSYQSIKIADLMNNSIFIDKNWELLDYFDLFSVATPASIINNVNCAGANIREFKISHHTQYNFMRQEQVGNKKLLNNEKKYILKIFFICINNNT